MTTKDVVCRRIGEKCYGIRELSLLYDISSFIIKGVDFVRTFTTVLEYTCNYLGAQSSFLAIFNRETHQIEIQAAYGLTEVEKSRGIYNVGEGAIGRVVDYKKPVVIRELSKSKFFLNRTRKNYVANGQESSFICVPVIDENVVAGTLSVSRAFDPEYNFDDDVRILLLDRCWCNRSRHASRRLKRSLACNNRTANCAKRWKRVLSR